MGRITHDEREEIAIKLANHKSINAIANELGRSKSTISTEIRRAGMTKETYRANKAQANANKSKRKCGRNRKITPNIDSMLEVLLVDKRFSPEQACAHLQKEYPLIPEVHFSHETVYHYIYTTSAGLRFYPYLRRKRSCRHKRGQAKKRTVPSIANRVSIHDRDPSIQERLVAGHWEGDLVIGANHKSAIGTLVERTTRYTLLIPIGTNKSSEFVMEAFAEKLQEVPSHLRLSMTYDNGVEAYKHHILKEKYGMQTYFADPGKPWQRGTNENTNGLLREFYPKKADLSKVTPEELQHIEDLLNNRPRKVLDFETPRQALLKRY